MKKIYFLSFFICTMVINAQQNKSNCNCCTDIHSQFDFWIGEWTVTTPNGDLAGHNVITKVQDNCILQENWTSAKSSYTGTSNNFYNATKKQWEQIWIDNQGGSLHLKGNRKDNQMILQSDELTNKEGKPFFHRITWTKNDDGSVRQLWETVTEDKKVNVAFDGLYKKTK